MPNSNDFEGPITSSYHNEDPTSDYRAKRITSGVPSQTFTGTPFDQPTVPRNGTFVYDTGSFHQEVRSRILGYEADLGNNPGQHMRVDEESSTSDFTRLIRTRENKADDFFDVGMDQQTGAISVNNALSPSGGFFATASARLSRNPADEDHPFEINSARKNFWDALEDPRGPVVGLQERGGLYRNREEISPQFLSNTQNSIYMPAWGVDGENLHLKETMGLQKRLQQQLNLDRASVANSLGQSIDPVLLGRKGDENHLVNLNSSIRNEVALDQDDNMLGIGGSKKVSLMGRYEAFTKLSMDGQRQDQTQMAMNLTDSTDAAFGYAEYHRNRLLGIGMPEGAAERPAGSAQWARTNTYRVPLDRFDQLGLSAGQSFEGGTVPGIQQTEGGSYTRSYIQDIQRDERSGFASITVDRSVDEVNSKFMGLKAFDHNVGSGGVPEGVDLITRLGSEKDFAMRMAALYTSDLSMVGPSQEMSGASAARSHFVNYLTDQLGMSQGEAEDGFNQGNIRPAFRPYVFGAAQNYFKNSWFGERYQRTVGADEVERYLAPGQSLSDLQFDTEGNVTSHPEMLRHDVLDPALASTFGARLVNDLTEAGTGQGIEKMRVQRRTEEGRYIVEARDASLDSWSIMRNRPEFSTSSHVFGADELNTMASANPALYNNLQALDRRGVLKNYGREISQAAQVNAGQSVNLDYGTPGGVMNGLDMHDTEGNPITFGGIRDQVRASAPDYMQEDEIAHQSLWELNRRTNGARIQVGSSLYGSAGAMATNFQLDKEGHSVATLGVEFANVLDLHERFAGQTDNLDAATQINEATGRLNKAQDALAEQPSIRKQAGGIVSGVFGGPQVSNSGLAFNEIAYNRGDFSKSLSRLTAEERDQRMSEFDNGFGVSSFTMYPHSDSSTAFLNLQAVDAAQVRQREGMGDFFVRPGGSVVHPSVNMLLNKDNDADFGMGIPFRGNTTPNASTEADIMRMVARSTGGEDVNARRVASRQLLSLFEGSMQKTVSPTSGQPYNIQQYADELSRSQQSKVEMGPNYNAGQREAMPFKREMIAGTILSDEQKEALVQAAGKSASSPYQVHLDMQEETDTATKFLLKARSNLAQPTLGVNGDLGLAGQASFFDIDNPEGGTNIPGFNQPLRMSQLSGPQDFSKFMISKLATQFMGREDYLNRSEGSDIPGQVRDVAQNLLPMGVANDEGRIGAMSSFLGRIHSEYSRLSEEEQLEYKFNNPQLDEFLGLAAPAGGKVGAQDYFFGNKNLAPEDRAMAPAVWNGYTARRAAMKKTYYGGVNDQGETDKYGKPPNGNWKLGTDIGDQGQERKWFQRNMTEDQTVGDFGSFQGLGGAEGNRMAVLRGAYHDVATNTGSTREQVDQNRIVAANMQHATQHTNHLAHEHLLGGTDEADEKLAAVNGAMAVFNMNRSKPVTVDDNRIAYNTETGRFTEPKPYGPKDEYDAAFALYQEVSNTLPVGHPDRVAATELYDEASYNQDMQPLANGGMLPPTIPPRVGTASPEEPERPGSSGSVGHGDTYHIQNRTTQYRAQPPTIPEIEALRGQLSFLDGFQGINDPSGLSHAQQGSLLGAVTSVQKLMARGESSLANNQNDPGTRYYDEVMNGGSNTLKHDLVTTLDNLQPLIAATSPIHEEARLNSLYGKGNGVLGEVGAARRFLGGNSGNIDDLVGILGNQGMSGDERGQARFTLERMQKSAGVLTGEGLHPGISEDQADQISGALAQSDNEGIRSVRPGQGKAAKAAPIPDELRSAVANSAQGYMGRNIDDVPRILEELKKGIAGIGDVSEETVKKAQNFVQAYKDSNKEMDQAIQTREGGGALTPRQQTLLGSDSNDQARARLGTQQTAAADITGALYTLGGDEGGEEPPSLGQRLGDFGSNLYNRAIRGQGLFHAKLAISTLVNPAIDAARNYMAGQAATDQQLYQSGQIVDGQLMNGQYGALTRQQAVSEQGQLEFGHQVYNAYGSFVNAAMGPQTTGGPLGAIAGIGAPALGVGVAATSLFNSTVGGIAASVTAGIGIGGYIANAINPNSADSVYQLGKYRANGDIGSNFQGFIGQAGNELKRPAVDALTGTPDAAGQAADVYYKAVQAVESGQMTPEQAAKAFPGFNIQNPGEILSQAANDWIKNQAFAEGLQSDQARQILGDYSTYHNGIPQGRQSAQMAAMTRAGGSLKPADDMAAAYGVSVFNKAGMAGMQDQLLNYQQQVQDAGGNVSLADAQLSKTAQDITQVNAQARMAGLQQLDVSSFAALQQANPDLYAAGINLKSVSTQVALSNKAYYQAAAPALRAAGQDFNAGNYQAGNQIEQNVLQNQPLYTQATGYGASPETLSAIGKMNVITDPAQAALAQQMAGGNSFALSRAAELAGRGDVGQGMVHTVNTQTGLGIFATGGFSNQDFQALAGGDPYGQLRISQSEFMRDGTRGLQNSQRVEGYAFQDYQRNLGIFQQAESYDIQTGSPNAGALRLNAQGFQTNPADFAAMQAGYAKYGLGQFNTGNGMSMYQVEDAQTKLSREQQQFGLNQQTQSLGIDVAQFALTGQNFAENFGQQQKEFAYSTGFQREQMGIQRNMAVTQQGWQREDLAYSRDQLQIQEAWTQEDYSRNIRYARGKDKRDLIREQGRATVEYAMQMGQQNRQENREGTQEQWSQTLFDKDKANFEQNVQFRAQEFALQKKQFDEGRVLDEQRLNLQQQAHTKQMGWLTQQFALEDQQRVLTRQATELQKGEQEQLNAKTQEYVTRQRALTDAINFADQRTSEWNAKIAANAQDGQLAATAIGLLNTALTGLTAAAQRSAQSVSQPQSFNLNTQYTSSPFFPHHEGGGLAGSVSPLNPVIGMSQWASNLFAHNAMGHGAPGYEGGGYTGSGALNAPVGVVHGGEFVVPANGSLVMRDEDLLTMVRKMVELLQHHSAALDKIASNPTSFQANFNGVLSAPQDIYQLSRARL